MFCVCVCVFFLTGDNSYLSTVQILDSLGPRRVQVDRGGGAGCAGLPEIYRDSSIPRGERGKYAIRVGRTVYSTVLYLPGVLPLAGVLEDFARDLGLTCPAA